ncbi:MAG: GNAT family N-acetyltransferase [Caulobacterales bacterium]
MIETERLILRPWREGDREPFAAIIGDPLVGAWLGGVLSRDQAGAAFDRMLAFWSEHHHGQFAAERKIDGVLVGRVGVRRVPLGWNHPMGGEVEVGWLLARDAWGSGYATEAGAAVLSWGFEVLAVPEIYSWTARTNHRSEAVMQRIGMVRAPDHDFDHPDLAADDPLRPHVVYVTPP